MCDNRKLFTLENHISLKKYFFFLKKDIKGNRTKYKVLYLYRENSTVSILVY